MEGTFSWIEIVSRILIDLVIPAASLVVVAYVARFLRARGVQVDEETAREQLRAIMEALVRTAEQQWGAGKGATKRQQVVTELKHLGYDPGEALVNAELEATVNRLTGEWAMRDAMTAMPEYEDPFDDEEHPYVQWPVEMIHSVPTASYTDLSNGTPEAEEEAPADAQ